MARTHETLVSLFDEIADSIRAHTGSSAEIVADTFPTAIDAIVNSQGKTATASDILSGETAVVNNAVVTGTMPYGSATTPETTQQQSSPSISVSSTGLVTADVSQQTVSITPTVVEGYITTGVAGTVTMSSNSNTYQLSTYNGEITIVDPT